MPRPEQMDRTISLYFPSKELLDEWREDSKNFSTSLNNYILEMAEKGRSIDASKTRSDILRNLSELKEENRKLRDDLRIKSIVVEKYETELYKLRYGGFAEVDSEKIIQHDENLVKLLRGGSTWNSTKILGKLYIDPKDSTAVKLVINQLEELRRFGLVKETTNGWRWVE